MNNKKKDLGPSGSYQQLSLMFAAFHGHSTVLCLTRVTRCFNVSGDTPIQRLFPIYDIRGQSTAFQVDQLSLTFIRTTIDEQ